MWRRRKVRGRGGANELNILKDEEFANVLHKMIILRTKEKLSYFFKERFVLASFYAKRMCVQRWQIAAISGEGGKANSFAVSDAFPFLPPATELLLLLSHHRRRTAKNTTKFPLQNSKRIFLLRQWKAPKQKSCDTPNHLGRRKSFFLRM